MLSDQARSVAHDLGLGAEHARWLDQLDAAGEPAEPLSAVTAEHWAAEHWAARVLARAGVDPDDATAVLATRRDIARSPALTWLLRRCTRLITARMGDAAAPPIPLPQLPAALGAAGRCFPAQVFLAALPATLAFHRERGIPAEASWAIFADLGRQMEIYRDRNGVVGVEEPWWLTLHLCGLIYEFGRLQFNLLRLGARPRAARFLVLRIQAGRLGTGFRPADEALGVHIPETGPLTPASCDQSLAAARSFFDRYFPSPTRRIAVCESWLLDDQLGGYLPARSNIVQFQRRFTLTPAWSSGDKDIIQFVLRRNLGDLAGVPRDTRLQRAIVTHLTSGRHWRVRTGWLTLPSGQPAS